MKALIYLSILFFSLKCNAQIEQVDVKTATSITRTNTTKYDSTEYVKKDGFDHIDFISGHNEDLFKDMIQRFVGQEIIILPKSHKYVSNDNFRFYGYGMTQNVYSGKNVNFPYNEDFYETIKPVPKIYKPVRTKCGSEELVKRSPGHEDGFFDHVSDYNSLAGKKFRIIDMTNRYYKLENEENGDQIYYSCFYRGIFRNDFYNIHPPLLVVGNFEKLKNIYLDKDFIYTKSFALIDNNSGQSLDKITNSEWKCTKIALADYADNPYQEITFILNNNAGNQIAVELDAFKKNFIDKVKYLQEIENERIREEEKKAAQEKIAKEEADREKRQAYEEKKEKLAAAKEAETIKDKKIANDKIKQQRKEDFIKKYGDKYGAIIADGQVKIGMTKEMCIAAWGNPIEKTKPNSVLEKWGYKSKSIYFDKAGIITAIQ